MIKIYSICKEINDSESRLNRDRNQRTVASRSRMNKKKRSNKASTNRQEEEEEKDEKEIKYNDFVTFTS